MTDARACSVKDCARVTRPKNSGLCNAHYLRMLRRGTTDPHIPIPVGERLAAGLERKPDGCLEWTGTTDSDGYGRITLGRRDEGAVSTHRLAWELVHGPIPPGLNVLHHCDNPPCCDAVDTEHHLFLGTQAENLADMASKGRAFNGNAAKTHCPADHEYTAANTYVGPDGSRACLICRRANQRARAHTVAANYQGA